MNNKPEPKFVPGERVVILMSLLFPDLVGEQTEIVAVHWLENGFRTDATPSYGYKTKENEGVNGRSWSKDQLGKLPPNTPTTFADCIFKPEKVTA